MSTGIRLPLGWAVAAAGVLFERWGMHPSACSIAGSVRRRCAEVGDLDLLAPLPPAAMRDELYEAIDRTVIVPDAAAKLFREGPDPFVEVKTGHKPHFKTLSVIAHLEATGEDGQPRSYPIPVQVNRFTRENRGWMELYKTGPRDFGVWFLVKWKERFGIPTHQKACIENHLRDQGGSIVPVATEADCFRLAGLTHFPPQEREEIARRGMAGWSQEQRERMS